MEVLIPTTFDNYTERKTWRGIERTSTTFYKGHKIFLKTTATHGIYCRITKIKMLNSKIIAHELYSSINPLVLLQWSKDLIDFRSNKISLYCRLFHQKFLDEQYSSIGRPIKICKKCKQ